MYSNEPVHLQVPLAVVLIYYPEWLRLDGSFVLGPVTYDVVSLAVFGNTLTGIISKFKLLLDVPLLHVVFATNCL